MRVVELCEPSGTKQPIRQAYSLLIDAHQVGVFQAKIRMYAFIHFNVLSASVLSLLNPAEMGPMPAGSRFTRFGAVTSLAWIP